MAIGESWRAGESDGRGGREGDRIVSFVLASQGLHYDVRSPRVYFPLTVDIQYGCDTCWHSHGFVKYRAVIIRRLQPLTQPLCVCVVCVWRGGGYPPAIHTCMLTSPVLF